MIDLPPLAIVAGTSAEIDIPADIVRPNEILLQNESPLTVVVTIGDASHRMAAWMGYKFPLGGLWRVALAPSQIQNPAPAPVPSSEILITVSDQGETIPGVWPAPLGGGRLIQNIQPPQLLLTTGTLFDAFTPIVSPPIPAGTAALMLACQFGGITVLKIVGTQSGIQYWPIAGGVQFFGASSPGVASTAYVVCPFNSQLDSTVTITGQANTVPAGGSAFTLSAFTYPQAMAVYPSIQGQQKSNQSFPVVLSSDSLPLSVRTSTPALQATSRPGANVQATVTFAAVPSGFRFLRQIAASLLTFTGGGASAPALQVLDAAAEIWAIHLAVNAPVQAQQIPPSKLDLSSSQGNSLTVQFQAAGGANVFEAVNASAD